MIVLSPDALHVRGIADRAGLPYSVVQREVDRLEAARLVASETFGRARVVRPNADHPLFRELRSLVLKTYGPREVLANLIAGERGVKEAYLYGSWAARYRGEWGDPPADVDVLIVGRVSPRWRDDLEAAAGAELAQPVHVEVVPPAEWLSAHDPFVRTIRERPLVEIPRGEP